MPDIPTQIRAALKAQGRSVRSLALAAGYTHDAALQRLLSGQHEPTDATLQRLADALGVELVRPALPEQRFKPARAAKTRQSATA